MSTKEATPKSSPWDKLEDMRDGEARMVVDAIVPSVRSVDAVLAVGNTNTPRLYIN